jgi:hypothetical protein
MIYRGPGFLAVLINRLLALPFPTSKLSLFLSPPVSPIELTEERGRGGMR